MDMTWMEWPLLPWLIGAVVVVIFGYLVAYVFHVWRWLLGDERHVAFVLVRRPRRIGRQLVLHPLKRLLASVNLLLAEPR